MHIKNIYYTAHSMHLSLLSLGVGIVEFWVLEGGQNIFLISGGGVVPWGGGGGGVDVMEGGWFILHPFSHFETQDFKNPKFFTCSALIFNIHIFRFNMDAGLQVDIYFNTESKFYCSCSCFFSLLSGHSKPTKPMKLLSVLSIWWV